MANSAHIRPADASAELDRILPQFHFTERHWTTVRAPPVKVFDAIEAVDLADSTIAKTLMAIWRIPARAFLRNLTNRPMSTADFILLHRAPPHDLVRGLVSGVARRTWSSDEYLSYVGPGFKLAWGFSVRVIGNGVCRVDTETRVLCCDSKTKRWFTMYWLIIRPWSGLIRRDLLRLIRRRAEGG